jgi:uncharacterized membrane protein
MPRCAGCGHPLTGAESHCPICRRSTMAARPWLDPMPPRPLQSLPVGSYIKIGWEIFKQYPYGFIGFCLVNIIINLALNFIPVLGGLAAFAVSPALAMGNFTVAAKLLQQHSPEFGDFFTGFNFFWPLLLVSLVASLFIVIGLFFLVIPGLYLLVAYLFASCLVVDRRLEFWPAMEMSRRAVNPLWFGFFAFLLILTVINLAGALLLGLGLLATIPISFCALTAAYDDLFGFSSDYREVEPRLKPF